MRNGHRPLCRSFTVRIGSIASIAMLLAAAPGLGQDGVGEPSTCPASPPPAMPAPAITAEEICATIAALAHDSLEGREAGRPGSARAAHPDDGELATLDLLVREPA
ncbi:MAG: hypothetical protein ACRDZV_03475 [Acidimicrobiia bacterium]